MIDDFFLEPDYSNILTLTDMFNYLHNQVSNMIDSSYPLVNGNIVDYSHFLNGRSIPQNQQEWKKVFKQFSELFQKSVIWQNPMTAINITPPVNIPATVAAFYSALFNPNFAKDESCGMLVTAEMLTIKYLSELVGWNPEKSSGIFTFGGKGTNLYAVKMGLNKCNPSHSDTGTTQNEIVISNDKAHPCHSEVCNWLGIGSHSCVKVKTDENGQMDIEEFEKFLRHSILSGKKIACIILNGGTTNEVIIDKISEIVRIRDRFVAEYQLNYIPHIHVDAVIGWAWLFFKSYDYEKNPIGMSEKEKKVFAHCVIKYLMFAWRIHLAQIFIKQDFVRIFQA